jgi:hypothetical protein
MLDHLQPPEIWDRINEAYRKAFGYPEENPLRCYSNLYMAVDEVTRQLASFLSHKRAFTYMKGFSPLFDSTLPFFLREGFQAQGIEWTAFERCGEDAESWVQALPPNTLFVLVFEDHAVTGQKADLSAIEKFLADKKIYLIRVSHWQLPSPQNPLSPFTIWVGPAHPGSNSPGLVVCGSRFRAPESAAGFGPWTSDHNCNFSILPEDQELVRHFESHFPSEVFFSIDKSRRFDRAVLCFSDLTGDLLLSCLEKKMGVLRLEEAATTHLCHWDSVKLFSRWWSPRPTPEQLRGLVIFSLNLLKRPDFLSLLQQTIAELRAETQWP